MIDFAPVVAARDVVAEAVAGTKSTRMGRPPLEKPENRTAPAGASAVPVVPSPLQDVIEKLATPVATGIDAALAQAELEEQRKNILLEAREVARIRQELDISMREYNSAHGFTPVANPVSRINEVRARGRDLNLEIERDGRARSARTASHVSAEKPRYSTPGKNLRAAEAAAAELPGLSDRKSTRLNSSHITRSRMPSSA